MIHSLQNVHQNQAWVDCCHLHPGWEDLLSLNHLGPRPCLSRAEIKGVSEAPASETACAQEDYAQKSGGASLPATELT